MLQCQRGKALSLIAACDKPLDVVFGIPVSQNIPADEFDAMKRFVGDVIESLEIGPNKVHVGLITYGGGSSTALNIDELDTKETLKDLSGRIPQQGSDVNVAAALEEAFHNTFTIYGGVRQSAPKALILLVPEGSSSSRQAVQDAAERLKSLGVRLLIIGVGANIDQSLYELASTQPASKFFYLVPDPLSLNTYGRSVADVVCKGKCCLVIYSPRYFERHYICPRELRGQTPCRLGNTLIL